MCKKRGRQRQHKQSIETGGHIGTGRQDSEEENKAIQRHPNKILLPCNYHTSPAFLCSTFFVCQCLQFQIPIPCPLQLPLPTHHITPSLPLRSNLTEVKPRVIPRTLRPHTSRASLLTPLLGLLVFLKVNALETTSFGESICSLFHLMVNIQSLETKHGLEVPTRTGTVFVGVLLGMFDLDWFGRFRGFRLRKRSWLGDFDWLWGVLTHWFLLLCGD